MDSGIPDWSQIYDNMIGSDSPQVDTLDTSQLIPTIAPPYSRSSTPDFVFSTEPLFSDHLGTTPMPEEPPAPPKYMPHSGQGITQLLNDSPASVYFTPYMTTPEFMNGASHSTSPRLPLPAISYQQQYHQLRDKLMDRSTRALPSVLRPGFTGPTFLDNLTEDDNSAAINAGYTDHSSGTLPAGLRDRTVISSTMSPSEVIQLLLQGGCSDVTRDLNLDLCGLLPSAGGGFGDIYNAREIYTWSKLKHPNVLELSGLAIFRDQISIVSPWMENGTLPEYITKNPTIDRPKLCAQISTGLAYLHTSGVVHGDIKGANILISACGVPKLSDSGNAVLKKYTLQFTGGTSSLNVSMRWTAPELLTGGDCFTKEADVFGLGMVFFEVITGKLPFHDKPEHVACALIIGGKTPGIPNDTKNVQESVDMLGHVMHQCWSFDAADRPSASQVEQQLREVDGSDASDEATC
ncbi:hypothetical protein FRC09_002206 [Ceratobasidium sp. 395]|nr:hypothetical protein FRC09_002206 [Ceratobasidium sp. 395]